MNRKPKIQEISATVAEYFNIAECHILGHQRCTEFVRARHILVYLLHTSRGESFSSISRFLNRDHTTIMYVVRKIARQVKHDARLHDDIESIREMMDAKGYTRPLKHPFDFHADNIATRS